MKKCYKEEGNIIRTAKRRKANWIGYILCRNCLLEQVIEGKVEGRIDVTGRLGRRSMQILGDVKEKRENWKLKEEALDRTVWRTGCGSVYEIGFREIGEERYE